MLLLELFYDTPFLIALLVFIILQVRRSKRLTRCEKKLEELEQKLSLISGSSSAGEMKAQDERSSNSIQRSEKLRVPCKNASANQTKTVQFEQARGLFKKFLQACKSVTLLSFISNNWIALVGSSACIIGSVFFGITSGMFKYPAMRVLLLIFFSALFMTFGFFLKNVGSMQRNILRSTGGAIFLFSMVGAGFIEGLQIFHSTPLSMIALVTGIGLNLLLTYTTIFQITSSLHIFFSLLSLFFLPQKIILLPVATLVTLSGLYRGYQRRWNLHLLCTIATFTFFHWFWIEQIGPIFAYQALVGLSVVIIHIYAGLIHYTKKFQGSNFDPLSLLVHLSNWILMGCSIYLYSPFSRWISLFLGILACSGFLLANYAKKKKSLWLYYADTLSSQVVLLLVIASLYKMGIKPIDLSFLSFIEMGVFTLIFYRLREKFLVRMGQIIQIITFFIFSIWTIVLLYKNPVTSYPLLQFRFCLAGTLYFCFYCYSRTKKWTVDSLNEISFGYVKTKQSYSILLLLISILLLFIRMHFISGILIQSSFLCILCILGIWRSKREDSSLNGSFLILWIGSHLYYTLSFLLLSSDVNQVDRIGILFLDLYLIFRNKLTFALWKKNLQQIGTYTFSILLAVFTYRISELSAPIAYLGYALTFIEISRFLTVKSHIPNRISVQKALFYSGLGFLFCYLFTFCSLHLQLELYWGKIFLRHISEVLGCLTLFYWISSIKKVFPYEKLNKQTKNIATEFLLAFVTLIVFTESVDVFRPLVWAIFALILLFGTKYYQWHHRIRLYSFLYLLASIIHGTFVTNYLVNILLGNHYMGIASVVLAIILQAIYGISSILPSFKMSAPNLFVANKSKSFLHLYKTPALTILLPIFLGSSLFFTINFEKTLLTLIWVGMASLYLMLTLIERCKRGIQISMFALFLCTARLLFFDLSQSDITSRAIVFLGAGIFMTIIGMIYKKYKYRLKAL